MRSLELSNGGNVRKMFVRSAGIVAGVVAAVTIMASTRVDGQGQPGGAVQMPATAMKWEPFAPGVPVDVVPLWGDRTKPGQYGMFLRLRAGQEAGMHAHTTDYYGVNVQGTWIRVLDGSTARTELPTGSYVFQPGKQFHNDICKGPEDCILLIHQAAGPSDVILPPAGTAR